MDEDAHYQTVMRWYKADREQNLRLAYPLTEDSVVFDLGAYDGAWSKEIHCRYKCTVHAFEPVSSCYKKAAANLRDIRKIHLHTYALKSFNGTADIFVDKDGSSFHNITSSKETVEVKSVVDVIKELKIDFIDLIKLNIEADEYEVLEALIAENMLAMFGSLQIQFHRDIPNYKARRQKIYDQLLKTHKRDYNFDFVWEGWSKA
ncbi:hypothetical protein LCGC14_0413740 [marine sediment metagenome]|uniref:Methyltransferase FkbM domain-containing protein n=1 Tax=marine sediment metagenome TaxID=412755 RepID=A0A0F9TB20_9ZZZZ